ncbi:MAG TPA: TetR/AcrR family transcriptional regulator [Hyphomicrobiales bacterium]|nr:TetR/AcrR family transcriptional regulator [Hyphomicrobiales bacterium]
MARIRRLKLSAVRKRPARQARNDLLAVALQIMERGDKVTISAAAKEAGISTGTAYRYFADSSALIIKAIQQQQIAIRGDILEDLQRRFAHTDNIEDRVLHVHQVTFDFVRRHESASRMFLAKSLESRIGPKNCVLDLRDVRRMRMYEMALEPLEHAIGPKSVADLVPALSAVSGMESYTVLKDLCGLGDDEIDRITRFNLLAILRAALSLCSEAH